MLKGAKMIPLPHENKGQKNRKIQTTIYRHFSIPLGKKKEFENWITLTRGLAALKVFNILIRGKLYLYRKVYARKAHWLKNIGRKFCWLKSI